MTFTTRQFTPVRSPQAWKDEKTPGTKKSGKFSGIFKRLIFLVIILMVIIGLFTFVLPIAEVTIIPTTTTHSLDLNLRFDTAQKKYDPDKNIFPAKIITQEKETSGTFPATGEKDMGEKADGIATFYNQTGLTQPITANTELHGPNGLIFKAVQNFNIPQASVSPEGEIVRGEIAIEIQADKAGEEGNLGSGHLIIPDLSPDKQNKIYGEITTGLTGGESKIVKVVSQEDIDSAQEELSEQLKNDLTTEMTNSINIEDKINENLVVWSIVSSEKSVELDKETEDFDIRIVLEGKAMIYNHQELEQIIKDKISKETGDEYSIVDSANNKIDLTPTQTDQEYTWADIKLHAEYQMAKDINLEELKNNIAGKTRSDARRILMQLPDIRDVRFNFKYSLSSSIPNNKNRIKILLKS